MGNRHSPQPPEDQSFSLRFGGGMNTRKAPGDLDPLEAQLLENCVIDVDRKSLRIRPPILRKYSVAPVATPSLPGGFTRGFAQLVKAQDGSADAGTISTVVQTDAGVFTPEPIADGLGGFTTSWNDALPAVSPPTIDPESRLRGHLTAVSDIDNVVIVTDLELKTPVLVWDGAELTTLAHNLGATRNFYAKYCVVEDERAWFANIRDENTAGNDTYLPHMVVGSERGDITNLSVSNRPSSALGEADPFFLLMPNLKPINAMVSVFGSLTFSTLYGKLYQLSGFSSKDFLIDSFFSGSSARGDEGMVLAANDVLYVNQSGKVDSLAGVQAFGDVEVDNVSRPLENALNNSVGENYLSPYRCVYNPDTGQLFVQENYVEPENFTAVNSILVFEKGIHDQQARDSSLLRQGAPISPWSRWSCRDAADGNDVRAPDLSGDMWVMYPGNNGDLPTSLETFLSSDRILFSLGSRQSFVSGTTFYADFWQGKPSLPAQGVGDTENITMKYRSKVISGPSSSELLDFTGILNYSTWSFNSSREPVCTLKIIGKGLRHFSHEIEIVLEEVSDNTEGDSRYTENSIKFSMPTLNYQDKIEISLEIDNQGAFVEILGIDFNVKA